MAVIENKNSNIKPGTVMAFPINSVPEGWLMCNGAAYSRTVYNKLFAVIGTTYGAGDGSTTFNVPDFRGRFLRGYGTDPADPNRYSDAIGTYQADGFKNHEHQVVGYYRGVEGDGGTAVHAFYLSGATAYTQVIPITVGGGLETRPVNMAVVYCIKY